MYICELSTIKNKYLKTIVAKYQIYGTFKITNREYIVIAGIIIEGKISIGDYISFSYNGKYFKKKINGIEEILSPNVNIGLLIDCHNENEILEILNWKSKNIVALITKV